MNTLLDEDALRHLLAQAADSYEVPAGGAARAQRAAGPARQRRGPSPKRWLQATAAAAVVGLAVLVVPHLGSSSSSGEKSSSSSSSAGGAGSAGSAGSAASGGTSSSASAGVRPGTAKAPFTTGKPGVTAPGPDGAATRVVKTGTISLGAPSGQVSAVLTAVQGVVEAQRGYVASSSTSEAGSAPSGTVTFRIPAANFERAVAQVRTLRATVRSVQTAGRDVTAEYADTAAQIASLRAARSRFLTILAGARTIAETLTVQQRVDDVQGQIDRLEGSRRVLADQSDLATLTVAVAERDAVQPSGGGGLGQAWHDAWHGFTSGIEAIIAASGRILVVLLVLAALAALARLSWRLVRRQLV